MADALFGEPRLAELYDPLDPDRRDLDVYAAMAAEFGAESVVDIGCGTGTLACLQYCRTAQRPPEGPREWRRNGSPRRRVRAC